MADLGRPLSSDAELALANGGELEGLPNGMREGYKFGWRLDFDAGKGPHFNWFDWTNGNKGTGGRWGAVRFAGDEDLQYELQLKFIYGGIEGMLK